MFNKNASLSQRGVFFLESKTFRKKHILALKTDAKVLQFCELTKF